MESIPSVQRAYMLLELIRMQDSFTAEEVTKMKQELLTLLEIK